MMPLADLFVHGSVLVDNALLAGVVPLHRRPGPLPACSDAEVLTIALARHRLGQPSERAFLEEVRRDWSPYFPCLPVQSEFDRRVRWLWGASEDLRQHLVSQLPEDAWQPASGGPRPPVRRPQAQGLAPDPTGRPRPDRHHAAPSSPWGGAVSLGGYHFTAVDVVSRCPPETD